MARASATDAPARLRAPRRRYAERANNIVHWSDLETGGHFAALETPDLLVADIREFFASRLA
jgi:pimeloyl-ACP methyl ester carboxylesterase